MASERKDEIPRKSKSELKDIVASARRQTPYGSHWRHKRTGTIYVCNGVILSADTAEALTIYTSDGLVWARHTKEFLTKFEPR